MMVNYSLTGSMTEEDEILLKDKPIFAMPCAQLNIPVKPGKISVLEGVEKVKKMAGVLNITQNHKLGDVVANNGTLGRLCLRIHLIENSHDALTELITKINNTLVIKDELGSDMFLERYDHKGYVYNDSSY